MQTVAMFGLSVSPARDVVVDRLTVKHSSSSSTLSEVMGTELHSVESLSSSTSVLYVYV